jgi:hypothetical protein
MRVQAGRLAVPQPAWQMAGRTMNEEHRLARHTASGLGIACIAHAGRRGHVRPVLLYHRVFSFFLSIYKNRYKPLQTLKLFLK